MPLPLVDGSKGAGAYPLPQSDLTLGDLPVVAGVPPPQSFLFHRALSQHKHTHTTNGIKPSLSSTAPHHFIAVLGRRRRLALPLLARRLLCNLDIGQRAG